MESLLNVLIIVSRWNLFNSLRTILRRKSPESVIFFLYFFIKNTQMDMFEFGAIVYNYPVIL